MDAAGPVGTGGPVRVRPARAGDAGGIAAVHVASWRRAYAGLLPTAVLDGLSVGQRTRLWDRILAEEPPERVVVAERSGEVVGFAHVGPARDGDVGATTGQLVTLYLHPDEWGQGVGTRVHDAGLGRLAADGCDRAVLWMLSTNVRAARFYSRRGWVRDGRIRVQQFGGAVVIDHRYSRDVRTG